MVKGPRSVMSVLRKADDLNDKHFKDKTPAPHSVLHILAKTDERNDKLFKNTAHVPHAVMSILSNMDKLNDKLFKDITDTMTDDQKTIETMMDTITDHQKTVKDQATTIKKMRTWRLKTILVDRQRKTALKAKDKKIKALRDHINHLADHI